MSAKEWGRRGGLLSAAVRMKKLTAEQRRAIAKNAVAAREAKRAAQRRSERNKQLEKQLKGLDAAARYLYRQVEIDGVQPATLAKLWGMPEPELRRRLEEARRKIRAIAAGGTP